jgi:hypothetical protein
MAFFRFHCWISWDPSPSGIVPKTADSASQVHPQIYGEMTGCPNGKTDRKSPLHFPGHFSTQIDGEMTKKETPKTKPRLIFCVNSSDLWLHETGLTFFSRQ